MFLSVSLRSVCISWLPFFLSTFSGLVFRIPHDFLWWGPCVFWATGVSWTVCLWHVDIVMVCFHVVLHGISFCFLDTSPYLAWGFLYAVGDERCVDDMAMLCLLCGITSGASGGGRRSVDNYCITAAPLIYFEGLWLDRYPAKWFYSAEKIFLHASFYNALAKVVTVEKSGSRSTETMLPFRNIGMAWTNLPCFHL